MKGTSLLFTADQVKCIEAAYRVMSRKSTLELVNREFGLCFGLPQFVAFVKNHRIKSGRTGHFAKGQPSHNAGTKGMRLTGPNSGSFVKGSVPGNIRPLGSERIDAKDGYVLVKVKEENPYTGARTRYKAKHQVIWEQLNGHLPKGHVIMFVDGDIQNFDQANLKCVHRRVLLQLTRRGYRKFPDELKPSVFALSNLEVKLFAAEKKNPK